MQMVLKKYSFIFVVLCTITTHSIAQEKVYSCKNAVYPQLKQLIGVWSVNTKDRLSPGNYETNNGESTITDLIIGCGIKESYRGTYKKKDYAREIMITGVDSIGVQMSILDSEHNSFAILNGEIKDNNIIVYWFRDREVKKLQSKYILTIENDKKFEFSSYLSTNYGESWALTHERSYTRIE